MKIEDLEAKITKKAAGETADAIVRFKGAVNKALHELFCPTGYAAPHNQPQKAALLILAGELPAKNGWPATLWRTRENAIREEVMSTMDTMQQVLLAKAVPPSDDTASVESSTE